jgi:Ca-activated chloride channel family protein
MQAAMTRLAAAALVATSLGCSMGYFGGQQPAARAVPTNADAFQMRYSAAVPAGAAAALPQEEPSNTDSFEHVDENDFRRVADAPLSTFGADVDTASYSIVRRMIAEGRRPPAGAVRIEEMLNYFPYEYPAPVGDEPFAVNVETAACPWALDHRLLRIGLKAREIQFLSKRPNNLVFLLDVSGSMAPADRLPLVVQSLRLLVENLDAQDRVSIVVYAGAAGIALPTTPCDQKGAILDALSRLTAGGSTNGGAGIELAYRTAKDAFIPNGNNRVILCTDGDFNVGVSSRSALVDLVAAKAKDGIALSVFGVGSGNLKDDMMERLADRGDGNYAYLDSVSEGRKALVAQAGGTLVSVAKDVKIQVEFNPAVVAAYRLIGYENRAMAAQDFNDDKKDSGDMGAGHCVTALYELVPAGAADGVPTVDPLKYQKPPERSAPSASGETCTVKLRYKEPESARSRLVEVPVVDANASCPQASGEFKFAAAVASFGMLMRGSKYAGSASFGAVSELAREGLGADSGGYRREFLDMVRRAAELPK